MAEADLTATTLRSMFHYDRDTGVFTRMGQTKPSGRIATKGYRQIAMLGQRFMAHRLAWLYVHGEWLGGQIDHINQVKDDNRISNLRVVTNKQNQENIYVWGHNKSGRRGVRLKDGKWIAEIVQFKKKLHLGTFATFEEAVVARESAEKIVYTHAPDYAQITATPRTSLFPKDIRFGPRAPF